MTISIVGSADTGCDGSLVSSLHLQLGKYIKPVKQGINSKVSVTVSGIYKAEKWELLSDENFVEIYLIDYLDFCEFSLVSFR